MINDLLNVFSNKVQNIDLLLQFRFEYLPLSTDGDIKLTTAVTEQSRDAKVLESYQQISSELKTSKIMFLK